MVAPLLRLAFAVILAVSGAVRAQTVVSPSLAQVFNSGMVLASVTQPDGKVIIGGSFSHVGAVMRPFLARLNPDGSLDEAWNPAPNANVRALALDGNGNVFVGGDFYIIAGLNRTHVAKVSLATGAAVAMWSANVEPAGLSSTSVHSLLADGAGSLFIGGTFSTVGGVSRNNLAKVSTEGTGPVDPTWNPNASSGVYALALFSSGFLFAGGDFTTIGGQARRSLALLGAFSTGAAEAAWNPDVWGTVRSLAVDSGGVLYVGGDFFQVAGQARRNLARFAPSGVLDPAWAPDPTGEVYAVAVDADRNSYVGGFFSQLSGVTRHGIAKFSSGGAVDGSFVPNTTPFSATVHSIRIAPTGDVHVGGVFYSMGGQSRAGFAMVDRNFGLTVPGMPSVLAAGAVNAIGRDANGRLVVGGSFGLMGDLVTRRTNLARFNADGSLDAAWAPSSARVSALAVEPGGDVYAGAFFGIRKFSGNGAGAHESTWAPNPNGSVDALLLDGSGNLYVGGNFSSISSQPRSGLARIATSGTGAVDNTWNPIIDGQVRALLLDGGNLYVGGLFSNVNLQSRNNLAKLSTTSGAALDSMWDPNPDFFVWTLASDGASLYVGGSFWEMGGQSRRCLAKVALGGNGALDTAWAPITTTDCIVASLALDGNGSVYPAGAYFSIGGQSRRHVAKVSTTGTGVADPSWNAQVTLGPWTIFMPVLFAVGLDGAGRVALGGQFIGLAGQSQVGFGLISATAGVPAITSADTSTFTVLSFNSFTVAATGTPAPTLSLSGSLPSGVGFEPSTGVLSGTPA
ncbi:MAG TPA: hypothetical protein VEC19_09425, partial [Usitatibacter sp.]|nr:hypothetical protein [Usitatibacter sp.]